MGAKDHPLGFVIVRKCEDPFAEDTGSLFWTWFAALAPRYDGDDETTRSVPGWTGNTLVAKEWETRRGAEAALRRIRSATLGEVAVVALYELPAK